MGFREHLAEDMSVFFNTEEFAELHTVNGAEVTAVVDNEALAGLYISRRMAEGHMEPKSLFTDSALIYVQKSELDFEPVPEQYIDFDGHMYIVTDVKLDGGVYAIVLGVNGH